MITLFLFLGIVLFLTGAGGLAFNLIDGTLMLGRAMFPSMRLHTMNFCIMLGCYGLGMAVVAGIMLA